LDIGPAPGRPPARQRHDFLIEGSGMLNRSTHHLGLLAAVTSFCIVSVVYSTLLIPWNVNTEELPYGQEVLRFLSGDFRQQFFDIPGTPFIALTAAITAVVLSALRIVHGWQEGSFVTLAFDHLNLVYFIMRCTSILAFGVAVWFVFVAAERFARRWAAFLGAAVFAAHPILASTLFYVRIEPFAVLLVSGAIVALLRAAETEKWRDYAAAGFVSGLAMAARFPLALAAFPVIVAYTLMKPAPISGFRAKLDLAVITVYVAVALTGAATAVRLLFFAKRSRLSDLFFMSIHRGGDYPLATRAIAILWLVLGMAVAVVTVLCLVPPVRRRILSWYSGTSVLTVFAFFPIGVLLGVPTLFAGANYFLQSLNMFIDRNTYIQPGLDHSIWGIVNLFVFGSDGLKSLFIPIPFFNGLGEAGVLFNIPLLLLFCCGLIARPPKRELYWAIIIGCFIGVLSQFGKLQTTRHIAGWLPLYCIVIAVGADWVAQRTAANRSWVAVAYASLIALIIWQRGVEFLPILTNAQTVNITALHEQALLQQKLDSWVRTNIAPSERIFHTCCEPMNASVLLNWMKFNGVAVPDTLPVRDSVIWFGELSALRSAGEGLVVTSRYPYPGAYVDYYRQKNPSELVDPYHDKRFKLTQSITVGSVTGLGANIYDVFEFNLDIAAPGSKRGRH
jgi:hypothetical protein